MSDTRIQVARAYLDGYMHKEAELDVDAGLNAHLRRADPEYWEDAVKLIQDFYRQGPGGDTHRKLVRDTNVKVGAVGGATLGGATGAAAGALGSGLYDKVVRGVSPSYKQALIASVLLGGLGAVGGGVAGAIKGGESAERQLGQEGYIDPLSGFGVYNRHRS